MPVANSSNITTIQILRSYSNSAPVTLDDGQLAYSFVSNTLFIGSNTGIKIIGDASTAIKSQAAYDQANAATVSSQAAYFHANGAFLKANGAFLKANAAFDNSNTKVSKSGDRMTGSLQFFGPDFAIGQYDSVGGIDLYANNNTSHAQLNFANTNFAYVDGYEAALQTPNSQVLAYTSGNVEIFTSTDGSATRDTWTFDTTGKLTVPGPISGLGESKLDFTTYGLNTAYLTTTNDDSTALFMGAMSAELYANTSVQIRTNTKGTSQNWTFDENGSLTFPDNTIQTTAYTPGGEIDELARATANAAYFHANGAFERANAAFIAANTGDVLGASAYFHANGAFIKANAAFDSANTKAAQSGYTANGIIFANAAGIITSSPNIQFISSNSTLITGNIVTLGTGGNISNANNIFANNFIATFNVTSSGINLLNYTQAAFNSINVQIGVNTTQNTRLTVIEGTDVSQNARMTISDGVNASQNVRLDYSNTALTIAQGVDNSQNVRLDYSNTRMDIIDGVNASQNVSISTQNNFITVIQGVDVGQNARITVSEGVDLSQNVRLDYSNTAITIIQGVDDTQNTRLTVAEATDVSQNVRLDFSNTRMTIIEGVNTSQNSRMTIIEGTDISQNNRMSIIEGVDVGQNTAIAATDGKMQAAYFHANGAFLKANAAFDLANVQIGVDNSQNTRMTVIEGTDVSQNARMTIIEGVDVTQNTNIANKLSLTGVASQLVTGNVVFGNDVTISGNLVVLGNTLSLNVSSLEVEDTLIQLGIGNYTTDVLTIGYVGHYNDGTNAHAGFIRDSGTKEFYAFQGYTPETTANVVNINDATFVKANIQGNWFKGNLIATTARVGGLDIGNFATASFNQANTGTVLAQASFNLANATVGVDATQNTRLTVIEGTNLSQNVRLDFSNTRMTIIDGVDATQNTAIAATDNKMQGAYNVANTADVRSVAAYFHANGAFIKANAAFDSINVQIGIDNTQNTRMTVIEGTDLSQNVSINTQNSFITIIQGVDVGQNSRMTIIEGTDVSQNARIAVSEGVDLSQNVRLDFSNSAITIIQGVDVGQNNRMAIIEGTDTSQNVRLDFSNTRMTIIEGVDVTQNTRLTVSEGVDASQNVRLDYSNTAITIIQGVDVGQNSRMAIIEGTDASQNVRLDYSNTALTIAQGVDNSQNVRLDYSNTALTIAQGVDNSQNVRLDYSNTALTITQGVDNSQNVRLDYSNTAINQISSAWTANTVLYANNAGYLANSNMRWNNVQNQLILGITGDTGNLAIGTTSSIAPITVVKTYNTPTGTEQFGSWIQTAYGIADTSLKQGLRLNTSTSHTSNTITNAMGLLNLTTAGGVGGTTASLYGYWARNDVAAGAYVTQSYLFLANDSGNTGNANNQYGFYASNLTKGLLGNYGFYGAVNTGNNAFNLYMAGTAPNYLAGSLTVANNVSSTSNTTGSLVVNGGIGITGNLFMSAANNYSFTTTESNSYRLGWTDNYFTRSPSYGGMYFSGTFLSVRSGPFYIEPASSFIVRSTISNDAGTNNTVLFAGSSPVKIQNTAPSTSNTTGSLIVGGGLGVSGNLYVGGTSAGVNGIYTDVLRYAANGLPWVMGSGEGAGTSIDQAARNTANSASANTIIIQGVDVDQNTRLTVSEGVDLSQNVRLDFSNTAITIIQGVDTTQNTRLTVIEGTDASQNVRLDYSNTALTIAQGVDNSQNVRLDFSNTRMTIIEGVDVGQNTRLTVIEGTDLSQNVRLDYSNTAITIVQGVDNSQNVRLDFSNTAITIIQGTDVSQNARMTIIEGTDVGQNSRITIIEGTDASQNVRLDYSNTAITIIQGVDVTQNTRLTVTEGTDASQNVRLDYSNARMTIIEGVDVTQNTNISNRLALSGVASQTVSGNVVFGNDVTVTGNLIVLGNTISLNVSSLEVDDSLIQLAIGNYYTDTLSIGYVGHYNDGTNAHAGFIRDASTKEFYAFQGYTPDTTGNVININAASFTKANIHGNWFKGNLIATTARVGGLDIKDFATAAFNQANTADVRSTASYFHANGAFIKANAAFDQANVTIGVDASQNARMTIIEGTDASQNVRLDYSNTAITIIQGVDSGQNSRMTIIEGTDVSQNVRLNFSNTRMDISDGVDASQNVRLDYSNTAIGGIQGVDVTQNTRLTVIEATDVSQNVRLDYSNTAITIIQGVDVGQNSRMTIIEGTDVSQNARMTIIEGTDVTQNTRIAVVEVRAQAAFDQANTGGGGGGATANLTSVVDTFTGNGYTTAFSLSVTPISINYTTAVVGGVSQPRSAYSVVGTTLTFTSAPENGQIIEVTTLFGGGSNVTSAYVENSNSVILVTNTVITGNCTVAANTGGLSVGPVVINTSQTVTVANNARWVIL